MTKAERFNKVQSVGRFHPYTCSQSHGAEVNRVLVATEGSDVVKCPTCDYEQSLPDVPDFAMVTLREEIAAFHAKP